MKHSLNKQSGFTLVEAIVAIGILASALLATLVLATQSINVTDVAQNKTQAEFLAEEGVELVRAFRESNNAFIHYSPNCTTNCNATVNFADITKNLSIGQSITFNMDAKGAENREGRVCIDEYTSPQSPDCYALYKESTSQYVVRSQGNDVTRFKRMITLTKKQDTDADTNTKIPYIEVAATVQFYNRGLVAPSAYTLTTQLYDWTSQ